MKNITIGQAINENKGFFKVNEVVKSFKNYRYLENNKYIKTYFDILKYEINAIALPKGIPSTVNLFLFLSCSKRFVLIGIRIFSISSSEIKSTSFCVHLRHSM